jgi:hypothetical protein
MEVVMSALLVHRARLLLAVVATLVVGSGCENELHPDDPGIELDFTGDDAFEEEGALVASSECSKDAILARAPNDERLWALAVAHRWIDLGVTYDRGRTFEGYRRDCSGFVSMAWGLGRPGASTAMMEPFSNNLSTVEIPVDQLLPGDAINRRTRRQLPEGGTIGHVRLFGGWINKAQGTHCILEYYSTGRVGRAMKGTLADLTDYTGVRKIGLSTTPRAGSTAPPPSAAAPTPNANTPGCGVMRGGEGLSPGQGKWSCDGRFHLIYQGDGNVVLYNLFGQPLWNTRTNGQAAGLFAMQTDGNLVVYKPGGTAIWNTRTHGNAGAGLAIQDDGNLVIYDTSWRALWSSGTAGR